jgi:hypothetical protein
MHGFMKSLLSLLFPAQESSRVMEVAYSSISGEDSANEKRSRIQALFQVCMADSKFVHQLLFNRSAGTCKHQQCNEAGNLYLRQTSDNFIDNTRQATRSILN